MGLCSSGPRRSVVILMPTPSRNTPPPPRFTSSDHPPRSSSRVRLVSESAQRHEDFQGASGSAVHFRPVRLDSAAIPGNLACVFRCEGAVIGPVSLIDLSAAGFAALAPPGVFIPPGSVLERFELLVSDQRVWSGEAFVVHGSENRIGGRFTSGVLDLQQLRLNVTLEGRLSVLREQRARLPAEWRAAVADLRQLLEDVRFELEEVERAEEDDPLRRAEEEVKQFAGLRDRWGTVFYEAASHLHQMSKL